MGFKLKLAYLIIVASVGTSAGLTAYYFVSKKNEEEVIATAEDIYEDPDIDKVVIVAGDQEIILSTRAEELMRRLLNKREKSSLLYT